VDREHHVDVTTSLDFEIEDKFLGDGPFTVGELLIVLLTTIAITATLMFGISMLAGLTCMVVWPILTRLMIFYKKKYRCRSWLWDIGYHIGMNGGGKGELPKTRKNKVYTGERKITRSAFTRTRKGGLVPGNNEQIYYGIPRIASFDAEKNTWGKSVTPQPEILATVIIEEDIYQPGAHRKKRRYEQDQPPKDGRPYDPLWDFTTVQIPYDWSKERAG